MPEQAFIYEAVRTPRGKQRGGALHSVKPIDLVSGLINSLLARHGSLDPTDINDVILGVVSPVGEQGAVIARTAALVSGLGETVPGTQINRFCASGLEAVNLAAAKVASGFDDLVLAGGVESMSRVPMFSNMVGGDGPFPPRMLARYDNRLVNQGISAEMIATTNRQEAVKQLAAGCDLVLVIGSPTSSNSNRLREVAQKMGCEAHLIGSAQELQPAWLVGRRRVGITAGASAPERCRHPLNQVLDLAPESHAGICFALSPTNLTTFHLDERLPISYPRRDRHRPGCRQRAGGRDPERGFQCQWLRGIHLPAQRYE